MTEAGRTAAERRGRLKLFVSYAPGAGKTCAMLKQALRQKGQGTDVAAGVVDPHGHACTARLLAALERLAGARAGKGRRNRPGCGAGARANAGIGETIWRIETGRQPPQHRARM